MLFRSPVVVVVAALERLARRKCAALPSSTMIHHGLIQIEHVLSTLRCHRHASLAARLRWRFFGGRPRPFLSVLGGRDSPERSVSVPSSGTAPPSAPLKSVGPSPATRRVADIARPTSCLLYVIQLPGVLERIRNGFCVMRPSSWDLKLLTILWLG